MKLYFVIRPIVRLAFKIYLKKINYFGTENIPHGKPMFFSSNHPTGFFEPCLLACFTPNIEYYFITRGDFFKKPIYRTLLESLNMIPIFRFKDGFANLKHNKTHLDNISKALSEKKSILIFTEGGTETVKRLRPIQKGMARMAFGSYDTYSDLDLQIVPVCVTYTDPHQFRSEVMVEFGKPIPLSNFYEIYTENNNKAINQLTSTVQDSMRSLIVEIEKPENDALTEQLFTLYRNSFPEPTFPVLQKSKRRLMAHQEIANRVNGLDDIALLTLKNRLDAYLNDLKNKKIDDLAIAQPYHASFKNTLALIFGFIPYLVGRIGHFIPVWYALKVRRERVKYLEFIGPVTAATCVSVVIVQYFILLIAALLINHWAFYGFVFILPFLGYYAITYTELWQKYRLCKALNATNTDGTSREYREGGVSTLQNEREAILKTVYR